MMRMRTHSRVHELVSSYHPVPLAGTKRDLEDPIPQIAARFPAHRGALVDRPGSRGVLVVSSGDELRIEQPRAHDSALMGSASSPLCAASPTTSDAARSEP